MSLPSPTPTACRCQGAVPRGVNTGAPGTGHCRAAHGLPRAPGDAWGPSSHPPCPAAGGCLHVAGECSCLPSSVTRPLLHNWGSGAKVRTRFSSCPCPLSCKECENPGPQRLSVAPPVTLSSSPSALSHFLGLCAACPTPWGPQGFLPLLQPGQNQHQLSSTGAQCYPI